MRNGQHDDERLTWSVASAADIDSFYGERPNQTMKAIVIRQGGRPVGIIGMLLDGPRVRAFSEYQPEFEPHLRSMTVLRAIKAAQRMFDESPRPVIAVKGSDSGILERIGFVPVADEVYKWPS
jgi:hypothetical protein